MAGFCLFLTGSAYYLWGKKDIKTMAVILSLFVAMCSILTYQRNKIWKNEIIMWEDVIHKSPQKARGYINLGWAYYNHGDDAQAMADYDKAIGLDPELIYPFDDRGLIFAKQGNFTQAITEYDKANTINPYFAKVYYDRGVSYFNLKNYAQALLDYNKAIELNPEYVDAYNDRGTLYNKQSNFNKAIADYTRSLGIDPNQAKIYYQRGINYYSSGVCGTAQEDIKKAKELGYPIDPKYNVFFKNTK